MDKYIISPPAGSTNNGVGAQDRPWKEGHFDSVKLNGGDLGEYLAESTGHGIVSGCAPSISGLTVTVGAGVVHLADGTRKEISASTVTLDAADSTNPRIDLVYITAVGVVAKVTGTAAASPSAPSVPANGISVATVSVAANASTGTIADMRDMLARWYNAGIVNVKDFGAVGDGVTDDTEAFRKALLAAKGTMLVVPKGSYYLSQNLFADDVIDVHDDGTYVDIKPVYPHDYILPSPDKFALVAKVNLNPDTTTDLVAESMTINTLTGALVMETITAGSVEEPITMIECDPSNNYMITRRKQMPQDFSSHGYSLSYLPESDRYMVDGAIVDASFNFVEYTPFAQETGYSKNITYDPICKLYVQFIDTQDEHPLVKVYDKNFQFIKQFYINHDMTIQPMPSSDIYFQNGWTMHNGHLFVVGFTWIGELSLLDGRLHSYQFGGVEGEGIAINNDGDMYISANVYGVGTRQVCIYKYTKGQIEKYSRNYGEGGILANNPEIISNINEIANTSITYIDNTNLEYISAPNSVGYNNERGFLLTLAMRKYGLGNSSVKQIFISDKSNTIYTRGFNQVNSDINLPWRIITARGYEITAFNEAIDINPPTSFTDYFTIYPEKSGILIAALATGTYLAVTDRGLLENRAPFVSGYRTPILYIPVIKGAAVNIYTDGTLSHVKISPFKFDL